MQLGIALSTENIKYVSENIGYSRDGIYQWRKLYLKEGALDLMNNKKFYQEKSRK